MKNALIRAQLLLLIIGTAVQAHDGSSSVAATERASNTVATEAVDLPFKIDLIDFLPASIQEYWKLVDTYPVFGSIVIFVSFFLAAFAIRSFVISALTKVSAANGGSGMDVIKHLRKPIFSTVAFFGFALAISALQIGWFGEALINLSLSVIVASWMRSVFAFSGPLLGLIAKKSTKYSFIEHQTIPLLDLVIKLLVILFGSYCLLLVWGINPLGWLASAGIVGIAVGFAAKDTLANVFSGFFIIVDAPYKIGDYVNLDSGERGRVSHIGLRSTRLLSRDDVEITLPNAIIANTKIVNESGGPSPTIRVTMSVGVAYESDVEKVIEILQRIGESHPEVCKEPAPRVRMRKFGASSLDFDLLCWIQKPEDRGRIRHELFITIHKEFRAEGVEIPYTKSDVYIKSLPNADADGSSIYE